MSRKRSSIIERKHDRAGLRLIKRAIHNRWEIPETLMAQLPKVVTALVASARTDRERLRAVEVLVAMQRDNLAALAMADKIERLDSGTPTERIELAPITLRVGGSA
mgnify:CR=1 FL=1